MAFPLAGRSTDLVSVRAPLPFPTAASGNSTAPRISADGRFVLFNSSANDLVPGDNGFLSLDVFVRDRASNTTVLVSMNLDGTGGGNDHSTWSGISTNGRYVLFESAASDLVAGDTNGANDIFVRDLLLRTTILVSVGIGGQPASGASSDAVMTPDGRYVAFVSSATNLVAGNNNYYIPNVYLRDLVAGTTSKVSVGANTPSGARMETPVITPDGRYVAFFSTAGGIVPGSPAGSHGEIYLRDLVANSTTWVSTNASVLASNLLGVMNAPSTHPAISDDGRFIAFKCGANLELSPYSGGQFTTLILRYDAVSNAAAIITTNGFPPWPQNEDVFGPEMTPDGRFVLFGQKDVINTTTNTSLYVWDSQTGSNVLVSVNANGRISFSSVSQAPACTADGRYVAFISNATNLVGNVISNGFHVYLRDLQANTTILVDADTNGIASTDFEGASPSLSADGVIVAFSGPDARLVAGDTNKALDVFLRNTTDSTTELVSKRDPTVTSTSGNGVSLYSQFSLSDDGRRIAFASHASDLVTNDTNATMDIFVRDLVTGSNLLVSVATNGASARSGASSSPAISGDGRFVAFVSSATNIVPITSPGQLPNIFLRDLQTGTNTVVSATPAGTQTGNSSSASPRISHDGRYVVYSTSASNLGGSPGVYRYDAILRTNVYLPSSVTNLPPSMSRDGRFVAYSIASQQMRVHDMVVGTDVYTTPTAVAAGALSPQGTRLLYQTSNSLTVADVKFNSNIVSFTTAVPIQGPAQWSTNDRFFVFVTASNIVTSSQPPDNNGTNDVFLYDLATRGLTLISFHRALISSANGPSDLPAVSGDGRFVAFRSFATDIFAGISNTPNVLLYDRFTGTNMLLTGAVGLKGWTTWASKPLVSTENGMVTFQSWNLGLVTNDLNRVQDIFVSVVAAGVDSDGDGIPDAWMMQHFGHPTGQPGDHSLAGDDPDGDGMSNLQEYAAGTDPLDPNSVFKTGIRLVVSTGGTELDWPAAQGRAYRVQYRDDLNDPQWHDAPGTVSINGNRGSYSASATPPRRIYRVTLWP